jgi:hypothetical protein
MRRARVAGPAGTNRDLNRRVTMLRDQTTRPKLAALSADDCARRDLARRPIPLEGQQSGADYGNRSRGPDRLCAAAAGMGDGEVAASIKGRASRLMKGGIP